eukprot:2698380-Rhodomonas_salina.1
MHVLHGLLVRRDFVLRGLLVRRDFVPVADDNALGTLLIARHDPKEDVKRTLRGHVAAQNGSRRSPKRTSRSRHSGTERSGHIQAGT